MGRLADHEAVVADEHAARLDSIPAMSRAQRLTFLAIAVVIAVVAVIVLSSSGGGDDEETATNAAATTADGRPPTATAEPGADATATPEPTPEPTATPKPQPPLIAARQGDASSSSPRASRSSFRARADQPEEIHVHGYDIEKEIGPEPIRISFPATITGIFEIEIHSTEEQIAELRVDPK